MKPTIVRRRGRALASLTAAMGLCLGAASVVSAPAQSAEPAGDCAARVPVSVVKGDAVTGLTVTGVGSSTAPEGFTGDAKTASVQRFAGTYVFHCHILEHEDNDMMQPYRIR